jgi:hypothetical protein
VTWSVVQGQHLLGRHYVWRKPEHRTVYVEYKRWRQSTADAFG